MNTPQSELFPWEEQDRESAVGPGSSETEGADPAHAPEPLEPGQAVAERRTMAAATPAADGVGAQVEHSAGATDAADPGEPGNAADANGAGESDAAIDDDLIEGIEEYLERVPGRERLIAPKEYYSISEVCELVGLKPHVLRYWETQFPVLNPSKNRSGNRVYQRKEIRLVLLVKHLLYEEKYTVEGAKQRIDQMRKGAELRDAAAAAMTEEARTLLRDDLRQLLRLLKPAGDA
jgi:DNA-binding transcriptional MerR regulator